MSIVDGWSDELAVTDHTRREAEHALQIRRGEAEPLKPGDPVPGCPADCPYCAVDALELSEPDRRHLLYVVHQLATLNPIDRRMAVEVGYDDWSRRGLLPPCDLLLALIARIPGARKSCPPVPEHRDALPVDAARARSILDVARELGIDLRRVGRSWRGPCPIHEGDGPNFSVDPERGMFKCFVCDASGDGITLVMAVRGVGFVDAVRWMAG